MPVIVELKPLVHLTEEQYGDFMTRLESSRVTPSADIGPLGSNTDSSDEENNMAVREGRLYVVDAGDILQGGWNAPNKTETIAGLATLLQTRVMPESEELRGT